MKNKNSHVNSIKPPPQSTTSLFVEIKYPDTRKRLNIHYKDEITSVLIESENYKFTSLINVLADRFQIDASIRPLLRLKTHEEGGRRITSLQDNSTYHEQELVLFQSTIKEIEIERSEQERIRKQQEILKAERLKFEEENRNYRSDSPFLKDALKLTELYKENTLISDSYPYSLQYLLTLDGCVEYALIFISDNLNYNDKGVTINDIMAYSPNSNELTEKIKIWIDSFIRCENNCHDICSIINHIVESFNSTYKSNIQSTTKCHPVNQIFPSNLKTLTTISHAQFLFNIQKMITNISDVLKLNLSKATQLLYKYQWNLSKLKGSIKDGTVKPDSEPKLIDRTRFKVLKFGDDADEDCSICYCPFEDQASVVQLACGHNFCYQCMSSYVNASVVDGNGSSSPITCMDRECGYVLDIVTVSNLILKNNERAFSQLNTMIINDIALLTKSKWCPGRTVGKSCNRLMFGGDQRNDTPFVQCLCGAHLCLGCGTNDPHWPSTCAKSHSVGEDMVDIQWIVNNTTLCRKCNYPIERNGGCNHITCRKCQHNLCYACGDNWSPRHYNCVIKDKASRFKSLLEKNGDESLFSTVLIAQHNITRINPFGALFNNLYGLSYRLGDEKDKEFVLRAAKLTLNIIRNKFTHDNEKEDTMNQLTSMIPNIFKIKKASDEQRHASLKAAQLKHNIEIDNIRSLICRLSLNGKPKEVLDTLFVQRSFPEFRKEVMDIVSGATHGKVILSPTFRLYNKFGHLVKSWTDILYNDQLFITKDDQEQFIPCPVEEEEEIEEISQEDLITRLSEIEIKSKGSQSKTQQQQASNNNNNNNSANKVDQLILVEASLLFADLYKLDDEKSYDLVFKVYHQSSQAIKTVDELINIVLASNIGKKFKRSRLLESSEYRAKEELVDLVKAEYPDYVANNPDLIERCLMECGYDVNLALALVLSEAQTDECARLQEQFDDEEEEELDDYLEYVDSLQSNNKISYERPKGKDARKDFW